MIATKLKKERSLRKLLKLIVELLLTAYIMLVGALGTTSLCELCLYKICEFGWLDISTERITKLSLGVGFTVGLAFFGFLGAMWITNWKNWKVALRRKAKT